MRAYVSGALQNATDLDAARQLYERLGEACRTAGWEAYVPHLRADPVRDLDLTNLEVAERDLDEIAAADAIVAYVGEPSLGVGAEIVLALKAGKQVIAIAEEGRRVSRFLIGLIELHPGLATFLRYVRIEDAEAWIGERLRQ